MSNRYDRTTPISFTELTRGKRELLDFHFMTYADHLLKDGHDPDSVIIGMVDAAFRLAYHLETKDDGRNDADIYDLSVCLKQHCDKFYAPLI